MAFNGKFGPYLKKGTDSRSLPTEDQLLNVTVDEALALFAQPKTRGRNAKGPLRDMGPDPDTGLAMVVKDGRFGPYVTDGTTNASLRRGDEVETLTVERAAELLAERRAAGPAEEEGDQEEGAGQEEGGRQEGTGQEGGRQEDGSCDEGSGDQAGGRPGRGAPEHQRRRVTGTRGRLVALEGIDGCGKSTQARLLAERLGAVSTFEPGATPLGESLRTLLLGRHGAPVAPGPRPC